MRRPGWRRAPVQRAPTPRLRGKRSAVACSSLQRRELAVPERVGRTLEVHFNHVLGTIEEDRQRRGGELEVPRIVNTTTDGHGPVWVEHVQLPRLGGNRELIDTGRTEI